MLTKFVVVFSILALMAAFAGTVPAVAHFTLFKTSVVSGTTLQAGEYRVLIGDGKVTFRLEKKTFEVPVKVEEAPKKFENTEIHYDGTNLNAIREITLGGSKIRLLFN
jgi:hypothetical protein